MRKALLATVAALALSAAPALARDVAGANAVGLTNITVGVGSGNLGNASPTNSFSASGSRIEARTTSTNTFSSGVGIAVQTPNGLSNGGQAGGFAETTALKASGLAENNNNLNASYQGGVGFGGNITNGQVQPPNGGYSTTAGNFAGSFNRSANSSAQTGLNGASFALINNVAGTVTNQTSGTAFGVGAAVSGAAGLR